jgi:hypothetical protein
MARGKKYATRRRPSSGGNLNIGHVVLSLMNIEAWCRALRDVLGTLNPDMALPVSQAQIDTILKDGPMRVHGGCPPPLRVVTGCPPPLKGSSGCPPPDSLD